MTIGNRKCPNLLARQQLSTRLPEAARSIKSKNILMKTESFLQIYFTFIWSYLCHNLEVVEQSKKENLLISIKKGNVQTTSNVDKKLFWYFWCGHRYESSFIEFCPDVMDLNFELKATFEPDMTEYVWWMEIVSKLHHLLQDTGYFLWDTIPIIRNWFTFWKNFVSILYQNQSSKQEIKKKIL